MNTHTSAATASATKKPHVNFARMISDGIFAVARNCAVCVCPFVRSAKTLVRKCLTR